MYEDDNETYAYERGQAARYDLTWNDTTHILTIGPRRGSFPGLVKQRKLNIVLMAGRTGSAAPPVVTKSIRYDGRHASVSLPGLVE